MLRFLFATWGTCDTDSGLVGKGVRGRDWDLGMIAFAPPSRRMIRGLCTWFGATCTKTKQTSVMAETRFWGLMLTDNVAGENDINKWRAFLRVRFHASIRSTCMRAHVQISGPHIILFFVVAITRKRHPLLFIPRFTQTPLTWLRCIAVMPDSKT